MQQLIRDCPMSLTVCELPDLSQVVVFVTHYHHVVSSQLNMTFLTIAETLLQFSRSWAPGFAPCQPSMEGPAARHYKGGKRIGTASDERYCNFERERRAAEG
jgi:hypothetical protein